MVVHPLDFFRSDNIIFCQLDLKLPNVKSTSLRIYIDPLMFIVIVSSFEYVYYEDNDTGFPLDADH